MFCLICQNRNAILCMMWVPFNYPSIHHLMCYSSSSPKSIASISEWSTQSRNAASNSSGGSTHAYQPPFSLSMPSLTPHHRPTLLAACCSTLRGSAVLRPSLRRPPHPLLDRVGPLSRGLLRLPQAGRTGQVPRDPSLRYPLGALDHRKRRYLPQLLHL
jgi:hypothetical protein